MLQNQAILISHFALNNYTPRLIYSSPNYGWTDIWSGYPDLAGFPASDKIRLQLNCFTPDQIGANYCINISQTICRCKLLIAWLMLSQQKLEQGDQDYTNMIRA